MATAERDALVETAEHDGPAGRVDRFDPPTVRRVTRMLATPASTKINATPEITAVLI